MFKNNFMDYNSMTKAELETLAGQDNQSAAQHLQYRIDLEAYANDLLSRAASGIGSNPPGNPPRPPGL